MTPEEALAIIEEALDYACSGLGEQGHAIVPKACRYIDVSNHLADGSLRLVGKQEREG